MTNKEIRKKWIDELPEFASDDAKEEAIMMNTANGQFFICRAIANALRIFDKSL